MKRFPLFWSRAAHCTKRQLKRTNPQIKLPFRITFKISLISGWPGATRGDRFLTPQLGTGPPFSPVIFNVSPCWLLSPAVARTSSRVAPFMGRMFRARTFSAKAHSAAAVLQSPTWWHTLHASVILPLCRRRDTSRETVQCSDNLSFLREENIVSC